MPALAAAALLAGLAAGPASPAAELGAVAAASARPPECVRFARVARRPDTLWERAREPELAAWCRVMARGASELATAPERARASARAAEQLAPGRAAALVLAARAALALGELEAAWGDFRRALARSASSVESPAALHDLAVVAARTGHAEEARRAYRALAARASLLPSEVRRERAYLEAACWVMDAGSSGLTEAIGYLEEARRHAQPGSGAVTLAALALALDRDGRGDEAQGAAAEAGGPWGLAELAGIDGEVPARAARALPVLPPGELAAMVGVLAERQDPALAEDAWRAVLAARPEGPWAEYAKRKLGSSGRARRVSR